jgi:hypothetical protein
VLNSPAVNRLGPAFTRSPDGRPRSPFDGLPELQGLPEDTFRTPIRKRKHSFSSVVSPLQSSPLKKVRVRSPGNEVEQKTILEDIDVARGRYDGATSPRPPKRRPVSPVTRSRALQTSGSLFMRSLQGGRSNRLTIRSTAGAGLFPRMSFKWIIAYIPTGWQDLTSDFHTRPEDRHSCTSYATDGQLALPFCNAACNSKYFESSFQCLC